MIADQEEFGELGDFAVYFERKRLFTTDIKTARYSMAVNLCCMKNRRSVVLCWVGVALLIASLGWPYSVKLLHNLGVFQRWDGFGLFVIGLRAMPWLAGTGVLLLVVAAIQRKPSTRP
jgi:hypothetical protein